MRPTTTSIPTGRSYPARRRLPRAVHAVMGRVRVLVGRGRDADPDLDRLHRVARHAAALTRISLRMAALLPRAGRDGQHLRAASTAYDQTLLIAAADLGLGVDLRAPLSPIDRLHLEAELALAGLRWSHSPGR